MPSRPSMSPATVPTAPAPFADFEFAFDPSLFPHPPPLPSSADLFSPSETTDLLGFLDNFNWEFENADSGHTDRSTRPYPNPHTSSSPEPSSLRHFTRSRTNGHTVARGHALEPSRSVSQARSTTSDTSSTVTTSANASRSQPPNASHDRSSSATPRAKALLSTPQKRLNHIMSEQKRRNAIRDGYAQLIALLAPAGSAPGLGMPTRGRPKGSGSRGKGRSKGKSGVLFRAVEYCRWLEEGRDALREEVLRLERVAGIHPPTP